MSDPQSGLNAALEGRYRIERELGAGGMATVYLARDLRHDRHVAIKVLRPELAAVIGADRFLAEIKTTANLQHPHILALYDSGHANGFLFYVMPYIEGETLREKLDRETQLGVEESVRIARDVADALDYAHRHDVIHRDIKPANILLHDGRPVVADFGIALAISAAGGGRLTETGMSLGTPHYMSPEQASADRELSARSDIYSVGCVLYEMLAGEPPHAGPTAQSVLVKILVEEPRPVSERRRTVPSNVAGAVSKAIEKLPADRFKTARAFADALADASFAYTPAEPAAKTAAGPSGVAETPGVDRPSPSTRAVLGLAIAVLGLAALAAWGWLGRPPSAERGVAIQAELTGLDLSGAAGVRLAVSPDGRWFVAGHIDESVSRDPALYVRSAGELDWRRLDGTEFGTNPTISPTGEWVAFSIEGENQINKMPLTGGAALPVAEGTAPHWGAEDVIVFERGGSLYRVDGSGGDPEVLLDSDTVYATRPHLLPNGRGVLFVKRRPGGSNSPIALFEVETGQVRELFRDGSQPLYAYGHVIFGHSDGALVAAPFDLETLDTTGSLVTVVPDVSVAPAGQVQAAVSENGTLLFGRRDVRIGTATPVWVGRDGSTVEIEPGWSVPFAINTTSIALSPEGDRLALSMEGSDRRADLWVRSLDGGQPQRVTFEGRWNRRPAWVEDGRALLFISNRRGQQEIWRVRADGSGTPDVVWGADVAIEEVAYSGGVPWVLYRTGGGGQGDDIYAVRLGIDTEPTPLAVTAANEQSPALSPDGRWLAYASDESDRDEIYVRPFPDVAGGRYLVSLNGGLEPVWGRTGRELFYKSLDDELIAVRIRAGADSTFSWEEQTALFSTSDYPASGRHQMYDVGPDDRRFVMLRLDGQLVTEWEVHLVANWFEELRRRTGS